MRGILLALIASTALAQGRVYDRGCNISSRRSSRGGVACAAADGGIPFSFSFAPSSGAGMGGACDCAEMVTAEGRAVTTARSTVAYCTKGLYPWLTGIASGDVVACPIDKPRVMKSATGVLGYLSEVDEQNVVWPSEDFSHANWTLERASGVAFPVLTVSDGSAFYAAPDGTNTASRVVFGACSGGVGMSQIVNTRCNGTYTVSVWVRSAVGTPQTIDVFRNDYADCVAAVGTWTRCYRNAIATAGQMMFGNACSSTGGTRPINDILIWGADCKPGAALTSYYKTTTAAGTRAADVSWVNTMAAMRTDLTTSATVTTSGSVPASAAYLDLATGTAAGDGVTYYDVGASTLKKLACTQATGGVASSSVSVASIAAAAASTVSCTYDGEALLTSCLNGTCTSGAVTAYPLELKTLVLGAAWNGFNFINQPNALLTNVSVTSSARKNIYLFGDSIVEGNTAGAGNQPQFIIHSQLGNAVAIVNRGVSSASVNDCRAAWDAELRIVRDAGSADRSHFMLQCGINNADAGVYDPTAVLAQLKSMLADGMDAGVHVLWSTITPSTTPALHNADINIPMRTYCAARGIPYADTYAALELAPPGTGVLDPAYSDGVSQVHLNAAGTSVETQRWISAGRW